MTTQVSTKFIKGSNMPYGKGAVAGTSVLAVTGFSAVGLALAAVTLVLVGMALMQLCKPSPAVRP